jgi:prevent-host-death family protein
MSMETVTAYAAKTHLSSLLEKVKNGQSITITKHGTPVAILMPAATKTKPDVKQTISGIIKFRDKHSLGNISIKSLIEEGRD